jgi:hypothetical protein
MMLYRHRLMSRVLSRSLLTKQRAGVGAFGSWQVRMEVFRMNEKAGHML